MTKSPSGKGLWMLGAVLSLVGCGGTGLEGTEDTTTGPSVESERPPVRSEPTQSEAEPDEANPGDVQGLAACYHVKCSNGTWYGPFRSVTYNNCAEYGKYYCPAHKLYYASNAWKAC